MEHWNIFNTPTSEPTLMDFSRSMNSNSSAMNRFNSMNGHTGGGPPSSMSSMNSNNMNPYNPSVNPPNPSLSGHNSSMNMHNSLNSSVNNMNPYGSSAMNSFNSSIGSSSSANVSGGYSSAANHGSNNSATPFNLNTSMPPPSGSQGHMPPPNTGYPPHHHQQPMQQQQQPMQQQQPQQQQQQQQHQSAARNRFSGSGSSSSSSSGNSYYDHPSAMPPARPTSFPPVPPPSMLPPANSPYYSNNSSNNMYNNSSSSNSYPPQAPSRPPAPLAPQPPPSNYYSDNTNNSSSNNSSFPPIGEFKIGTFTMGANGLPSETSGPETSNRSFSGSTGGGTTNGSGSDSNQNVRETGIIEKLLQTYGFIQCCERQARLFFHFSQFDGNTDHLRIGDPVEFEVTFDRRTGKPIASTVQKISPEVVLGEERVVGAVTTALVSESGTETQGRISYENRGECFFLPYGKDDVEGYVVLKPGDKVSFQIATNQRSGNLAARHVRLENPVAPVRYQGVVSAIKDAYGFIERADVVDEIVFHVSETKHIPGGLKLGDDVDFCIAMRAGKEVAMELVKLKDGSVVFEDTSLELVRGQVLKTVERSPRHNPKEPLPGRIRYRGKDRSEVEVKFGERDQRGEFTLRHGDWVEFNIATDRRDRLQKATNITLLDDSFLVSGERREQGVVHLLKEECGYILCCDRDLLLHFFYRELLDPVVAVSIGDELSFTVSVDNTLTGPKKETATRIARLPPGTVLFEVQVQEDLHGQVSVVAHPPPALVPPPSPGSIVPPREVLGELTYLVEGSPHTIEYAYSNSTADIALGDKVTFSVYFSKRLKKLIAIKVSHTSLSAVTNGCAEDANDMGQQRSSSPPAVDGGASAVLITPALPSPSTSTAPSSSLTGPPSPEASVPAVSSAPGAASTDAVAAAAGIRKPAAATNGIKTNGKQQRQMYQGFVAALKESFGFVETVHHDKEIFFHFSNVESGESAKLELGDEVEYSLSSRTGPGGKVSAENITPLPKGTLPTPKVLKAIFNGLVIRPIRSSNPEQAEYCGLLAVDTDDVERSEQYRFGITGVVNKRELLQKGDTVTFQVDETGWATNIAAVRKKLIATVDTVKGQYGFLNYEAEEGKKLFFHQTEVKDKANLSPGDEVEFVIITNQKTGKSSACSIARIMPAGGQSRRPQRLISQLKTMSLDQSKPRLVVVRQPRGPDGTKGFAVTRDQLYSGLLA